MTDEERARIKAEAEATLKRLADFPKSYEPPGDGQPNRVHRHDLPPPEDPVSKWRREADAQEARFAAARAERRRQEREDERTAREMDARTQRAWDEYVDRRIAAALAAQQDNVA